MVSGEYDKNRRRNLIVDRKFQIRFLVLPMLSVTLNTILFFCILWLSIRFLGHGQPSSYIWLILVLCAGLLIVNFALVIYLGLIASNRYAGPLYRLKKSIDDLIKGSYGKTILFRDSDMECRLDKIYNDLSATLKERVEQDLTFADQLITKLKSTPSDSSAKINGQLDMVIDELERFKQAKLNNLNIQ